MESRKTAVDSFIHSHIWQSSTLLFQRHLGIYRIKYYIFLLSNCPSVRFCHSQLIPPILVSAKIFPRNSSRNRHQRLDVPSVQVFQVIVPAVCRILRLKSCFNLAPIHNWQHIGATNRWPCSRSDTLFEDTNHLGFCIFGAYSATKLHCSFFLFETFKRFRNSLDMTLKYWKTA